MVINPLFLRRLAHLFSLLLALLTAQPALAETLAAWSPDGQTLALVLDDPRDSRQWIGFWDAKTERKTGIDVQATPDFRYTSLAYSHDGRLLAAGRSAGHSHTMLQVFDAHMGGQLLQVSVPGEDSARVLGFSTDDGLLILQLGSGKVVAVGTVAGDVKTQFGPANLGTLSPNGRWLGLSNGLRVQVLDLSGQHEPITIPQAAVVRLAFGRDGEALAATVPEGVVTWQLPDGHELYRQALNPKPDSMSDSDLVYGVDRRSLLVRTGGRLYVLDHDNGSQRQVINGVEAEASVLLPDPQHRERLLVGGKHRLPLFWNVYFGGHQPLLLENPQLHSAALSSNGQWLALGTATTLNEGGFVRLLRLGSGAHFDLPGATRSLAFMGPELLAADDSRGRLVVWSLTDKQLKARVDGYCAGDGRIVGGSESAGLVLSRCELPDGSVSSDLRDAGGALKQHWSERAVGLSPSGHYVVFSDAQGAVLLDLRTSLRRTLLAAQAYHADRAAFAADELSLVVGDDQAAAFYDYEMGMTLPRLLVTTGLIGRLSAHALTADNQLLATSDNGLSRAAQPVRRWNLKAGGHDPVEFAGGHTGRIIGIFPLADNGRFITVGEDGVAREWEKDGASHPLAQINAGNP